MATKQTMRDCGNLADLQAMVAIAEMVGVSLDEQYTVYTVEGFSANDGEPKAIDPTKQPGLVQYQWEDQDEMWRDGKQLWRMCNARFYNELWVLTKHGVRKGKMANDCSSYELHGEVAAMQTHVTDHLWCE